MPGAVGDQPAEDFIGVVASSPVIGVVLDGSMAMKSASLPDSIEPIGLFEAERSRAAERPRRSQSSGFEAVPGPEPADRRAYWAYAPARMPEDGQFRARRRRRPQARRTARPRVAGEGHRPAREEQVRRRAVRDARAGLDEPRDLALGEVDRVGETVRCPRPPARSYTSV